MKPASLKREEGEPKIAEPFRPLWQPHIYHPKTMAADFKPQMLRRKSGAKVRPHAVYNHDDRETFVPEGYPWHCIGRIFVTTGASGDGSRVTGTGALVGSRTVLTSTHLIPWDRERVTIKFVPGYLNGRSVFGGGVESWATRVRGYVGGGQGWDLAVVRLADPLGDWLGTFGGRTYDDDWEDDPRWTLVGYPGEINVSFIFSPPFVTSTKTNGELPTRQFGISVEDDDSDGDALELEHYGDSTDGNSGGPLFGHWPKGPYIIGVESGAEILQVLGATVASNNLAAGGNAMVDLVRWARDNWI